jgi:3-oxoadipate enol-lactonase
MRTAMLLLLSAVTIQAQVQSGVATRQVSVGDALINYTSTGSGPAIVFIHGWSQDLSIWDDQVAAFSPRYRVIRYDSRGFGESGGHADGSAEPDDLRILLDSLGIRRAHVVGLSRGARVALRFAVLFPERVDGLVLYGLGPVPGFQPLPQGAGTGPLGRFRQIARDHGLDSLGKFIDASPLAWRPPEHSEFQERFWRQWRKYKGRDLLDPRPPSGRTRDVTIADVDSIRARTLIIHGDHELELNKLVADTLMRRMPNATRVVIANGGHGAHFVQPETFNRALSEFFDSLRK